MCVSEWHGPQLARRTLAFSDLLLSSLKLDLLVNLQVKAKQQKELSELQRVQEQERQLVFHQQQAEWQGLAHRLQVALQSLRVSLLVLCVRLKCLKHRGPFICSGFLSRLAG